jgi:hypothetical protein
VAPWNGRIAVVAVSLAYFATRFWLSIHPTMQQVAAPKGPTHTYSRRLVQMQLEDLPAVIGSPSSNTFVQWMRFNTDGLIACVCSLTG